MRIAAFVLLLTVLCGDAAMAQGMTFGAKGGINLSNVSFDGDDPPFKSRVGVLAGGFVTVRLWSWLTLQPEVVYTVKGATLDVEDLDSAFITDYVEVPVLVRFNIYRSVYVAGGPAPAFLTRARSRTEFGGSTEEIDIKDDLESFDLGIVGAAGIDFGRWFVDARYTHGISDIDADKEDDVKIRNRVFSVSAGIKF